MKNGTSGLWEFQDCADSHLIVLRGSNKADSFLPPDGRVKCQPCVNQPELYLSWTSFTKVTLAERRKMPSISKPDAKTHRERDEGGETSW